MSLDVYLKGRITTTVFDYNITHNLGKMADAVDLGVNFGGLTLYDVLWRPDEHGFTRAGQILEHLERGLLLLRANPSYYQQFNPSNGWGDYEGLVKFVEAYIVAGKRCKSAKIHISR